jgi:hypothetical protein
VRAVLFADELLVHDFFELDHFGGGVWVFAGAFGGDAVARGDDGEL